MDVFKQAIPDPDAPAPQASAHTQGGEPLLAAEGSLAHHLLPSLDLENGIDPAADPTAELKAELRGEAGTPLAIMVRQPVIWEAAAKLAADADR